MKHAPVRTALRFGAVITALAVVSLTAPTPAIAPAGQPSRDPASQTLRLQAEDFVPGTGAAATATLQAPAAWADGHTGRGVRVAVIDTGIANHPDLAGRVVASFDVTGATAPGDQHGHGTFMAGLVAGDGATSAGRYTGVAPEAELVSIDVADEEGNTSLDRVLTGLAIVDAMADELNVRVVLLSLSGPAGPRQDVLQRALEQLWTNGIVVVVAVGNDGPDARSAGTPGVDPYVLTVGAIDDAGTSARSDDAVPDWSSVGPGRLRAPKPELLAPGTSVTSLRVAGSTIDQANPQARVDQAYLRGSGTSMSAALTAGAAAVLVEAHPELDPDQVKGRLLASTAPAPSGTAQAAAGSGVLDVAAALARPAPAANQDLPPLRAQRRSATDVAPHSAREHLAAIPAWRLDQNGHWTAWNWTAWNWTAWNWAAWNWTAWNWAAWNWAAWNWAGWSWTHADWAGWSWTSDAWR